MAGKRQHLLSDDGSPIVIGDSSVGIGRPPNSLRGLVSAGPHIYLQHRCFHKVTFGLAIQNASTKCESITLPTGETRPLKTPWSLILNDTVIIGSLNNLTIEILYIPEYDLSAIDVPAAGGCPAYPATLLVIGNKKLSSAILNVEPIQLVPDKGFQINYPGPCPPLR